MQVSSPAETTAMQPDQGMLPLGLNSSTFRGENGEESLVISCEREARDGDGGWSRKHSQEIKGRFQRVVRLQAKTCER